MTKGYEYHKKWRMSHPDTRYKGKARYYAKTQNAPNFQQPWSQADEQAVWEHKLTDTELSAKLGRSVNAIQKKRCRLKKVRARREQQN